MINMSRGKRLSKSQVSISEEAKAAYYLTFKLDLIKTELIRRADAIYRPTCRLDVRSLRVLRLICDLPGVTSTRLRTLTLIEKTTLSKLLSVLSERSFIHRTADPDDSRYLKLWPTDSGHRVRAESDKLARAMEVEMLWMLSAKERVKLNLLIDKVLDSLCLAAPPDESV